MVTFVSNTGQVDTAIGYYTDTQQRAQQFTTGDHTGGYTLSKVVVDIGNPCSIAPAFALYGSTTDGGMLEVPGAKIVDLVGSAASRGEQSFTPATATTLAHSTRYFVLFKTATAASITDCKVSRTISHSVDHGAVSGWDIAGEAVFSPDAGETWTNTPSSPEDPPPPIQIAIRGSLIATDTAPGQPKNLTATPGNSRLALRWERPQPHGYGPHERGRVYVRGARAECAGRWANREDDRYAFFDDSDKRGKRGNPDGINAYGQLPEPVPSRDGD